MVVAVGGREKMCGGVGESGSQEKDYEQRTQRKDYEQRTQRKEEGDKWIVKLRKKRTINGTQSG